MPASRRDELVASLEAELNANAGQANSMRRLSWLLSQCQEYVDRWMGFCRLGVFPMTALVHNDLFVMIVVGFEAVGRELDRGQFQASWSEDWRNLCALARTLQEEPSLLDAENMRSELIRVRSRLAATE